MKCIIEIEMDNEAFEDDSGFELARMFQHLALDVAHKVTPQVLWDSNGNKVGEMKIIDEAPQKAEDGYDAGPSGFTKGNY